MRVFLIRGVVAIVWAVVFVMVARSLRTDAWAGLVLTVAMPKVDERSRLIAGSC